jgi:hypothetical protein
MMRRTANILIKVLALMTVFGCATSSSVTVNPSASTIAFNSAYLVVHEEQSSDMDARIQRELLVHGLQVKIGPDVRTLPNVDVIVRYADNWRWDMAMYLRTLDIQVYDASGTLFVTGSWKNSLLHGFHDPDDIVKQVVDEIFAKLRLGGQKR